MSVTRECHRTRGQTAAVMVPFCSGASCHDFPARASDHFPGGHLHRFGTWTPVSPRGRFRSLAAAGNGWPVEDGPRSVSPWFSGGCVSGGPETPLPTLKTGNGESRSWVQIPPHPFFWNGFFSAAELEFRLETLRSRVLPLQGDFPADRSPETRRGRWPPRSSSALDSRSKAGPA